MSHRYCGRDFAAEEIALIRALIAADPTRSRAALSRLTCQALAWYKPDGGLKDMSARVAMLRMHADGLITLPPPRNPRPATCVCLSTLSDPQPPREQPAAAFDGDGQVGFAYARVNYALDCSDFDAVSRGGLAIDVDVNVWLPRQRFRRDIACATNRAERVGGFAR